MLDNSTAKQNPRGINTDDETYTQTGLQPGWTQIATGPSSNWSAPQSIPFSFDFNGGNVTSYRISPNGAISFSTAATLPNIGSTAEALPSSKLPDSTLAYWGLTIADGNDRIGTKTFGTPGSRQHWISWISAKSAGTQNGWVYVSIVLEETTNKIYFVDQRIQCVTAGGQGCTGRPALTAGIQIDGTTAFSVTGSPNYGGVSGNDLTPIDNGYFTFTPGTQPADDIHVKSIVMKKWLKLADKPFDIQGVLRNIGSGILQSYDIEYSVNGGSAVSGNVTGRNVASGAEDAYTHPTKWNPTAAGKYIIIVTVKNPNGNTDPDMSNNTVTFETNVVDQFVQRQPLYEIYTSSTCGPCKPGNENYHSIVGNYPGQYTEVKFQQNFPGSGDPYCTDETVARRGFYSINSIPRMEIDGGWDGNANSFTSTLHTEAYDIPSFVDLTGSKVSFAGGDTSAGSADANVMCNVTVEIDPIQDFAGTNTLFVAVFEKETFKNVKSNGETKFENVVKKMLPDENGTNIGALTKGSKKTETLSFKFTGKYRLPADGQQASRIDNSKEHSVEQFSDLGVAIWIQDANKNVLQSIYATPEYALGTNEITGEENIFNVFPNPAKDVANILLAGDSEISIYDITGKLVYSTVGHEGMNTVDVSAFDAGVYTVRVDTENTFSTQKLIVE
jgi:hypothetical protein